MRALPDIRAISILPLRVDHTQSVQLRKSVFLIGDELIQAHAVDASLGELFLHLVADRLHGEIDFIDGIVDLGCQNMRQILT